MIDPELFRRQSPAPEPDLRYLKDPELLRTVRNAVVNGLAKDIDAMLKPLGYRKKASTWSKISPFGRSLLQIQRSQYGFNLFINAATRSHLDLTPTQWMRIQQFCPELPQRDYQIDLEYVALHENPALRDALLEIIRTRLIPWIEARHGVLSLFSSRTPKDTAKTPLFQSA